MADSREDRSTKSDSSSKPVKNSEGEVQASRVGGTTAKDTGATSESELFNTKDNEPVRDRKPDYSKGEPVTRYFTKDGTPVEPSSLPPAVTPSNLAGFDLSKREDVVEVIEYLDKDTGEVVTHDHLASKNK